MSQQAPAAPDYGAAAEQTAKSSRDVTEQQTWANRPTMNTPWGQQTWEVTPTWDPSTGQYINSWAMNTNLTDIGQKTLDSQNQVGLERSKLAESLTGRMQDEYGQSIDWSQIPEAGQNVNVPNMGFAPQGASAVQGPQYSPENIQRSLSNEGMQDVSSANKYYDDAENAIYNKWSKRQEPLMAQQMEANRTQLYNQGLREGDEAYNREMQRLQNQQSDAREQAQYQATIGAGSEAQRMMGMDKGLREMQFGERGMMGNFYNQAADQAFNQNLTAGQTGYQNQKDYQNQLQNIRGNYLGEQGTQFGQQMQQSQYQNQLRQQAMAEEQQKRGWTLNEMNALLSGQQVGMPSMPSFNQANASQATNYTGAAKDQYQASMDAFNAQQQMMQSLMGGATSLGKSAMMFSDRRLKRDIVPWKKYGDLMLYTFRYIWSDTVQIGFMADEVEKYQPDAVIDGPFGYKMVNLGAIHG